jgi:hypothetical protein
MQWFVKPETVRIDLPGGEWIDVKKQLTKGERDKVNAMLIKEVRSDGRMTPDFEMMSKAEALGYIVDWSLTDGGQKIPIESDADKLSAINSMSVEGFDAISDAIAAHVKAIDAERPTKKAMRGGKRSSAISASAA